LDDQTYDIVTDVRELVLHTCRSLCKLTHERQSAQMSKITNDGLSRSGTGCFIAVPIWQQ